MSHPPDDVPQAVHEHYESLYDRLKALETSHAELLVLIKALRESMHADFPETCALMDGPIATADALTK